LNNQSRKPRIIEITVKKALTRSGLPDIDYALNPYLGCLHGCIYCYARNYTYIKEIRENWGRVVAVKTNLIDILRKEISMVKKGVVGVGTITDPYQPVEAIYELTRRSLILLLEKGFHTSIQTKNTLILRDIDIFEKYVDRIDIGFTITTMNNETARLIEPYSSPPTMRAFALEKISSRGIDTWIFYGPVIPKLNDDEETIKNILLLAKKTRSRVLVDNLHIKSFMYDSNHPLRKYVYMARRYDWKKFYDKVLEMCSSENVKCIIGFYEPSDKHILLDKFVA